MYILIDAKRRLAIKLVTLKKYGEKNMVSKKQKVDYTKFNFAQFKLREEKDDNNVYIMLMSKLAGMQWRLSPFKPRQGLTLQILGNALGFKETFYKDLLKYHDYRLKTQKHVSDFIYYLVCILVLLPLVLLISYITKNSPVYINILLIIVSFLFSSVGAVKLPFFIPMISRQTQAF